MRWSLILLISLSFSLSGRELFFKNCIRCHYEGSRLPLSYLKKEYRGEYETVLELINRCPFGRGLTKEQKEAIAKFLSGLR